ncbi:hypothetical protein [Streptomyces sp. NPDC059761]|uniref:hypothetical protein n=1 Tax=Streptomyces sp. NPDC059761 TaxID=3346937 RepID=UPI0036494F1A
MRAHFNRPITDRLGNQIDEAQVRLLVQGGTEPIPQTIYVAATGGLTRTNPWTLTNGEVDFFLDDPTRLQIGITVPGSPEELWDSIDVLAVNSDSTHVGSALDSTQVGLSAVSTGIGGTSLGKAAAAAGDHATALGAESVASAAGALASGSRAEATQAGAIAIGESSVSSGSQSLALGTGARATHNRSAAIGSGAEATRPEQIMIGTPTSLVEFAGTTVLRSPGGQPFILAVADSGQLYTVPLQPYVPVIPDPPEGG